MSVTFILDWLRGKAEVNQETIQHCIMICCIMGYQNKSLVNECVQYQYFISPSYPKDNLVK
uniref:Uncharacterized protein n=1 Tax=Monodon monoceros TaxID=40151 RepID=A0A8C6BRW8_MONMO